MLIGQIAAQSGCLGKLEVEKGKNAKVKIMAESSLRQSSK